MNKEIKEILNYMKQYVENKYEHDSEPMLNWKDIKCVLDYITNLQEENQRLKELCDKYEEEHNTAFKLWTMKMEEMPTYEEKEEYKSRIDKAIEYLNEPNRDEFDYSVTYLLEILQGGEE